MNIAVRTYQDDGDWKEVFFDDYDYAIAYQEYLVFDLGLDAEIVE